MKMQLILMLLHLFFGCGHSIGYSYTRFVGPVTAPEQKLYLKHANDGIGPIHYVGYPKYQFSYGVEDAEQGMLQNRKETRDGDNVHGVYSLVDPDGSLRTVKYTADNVNGFQAEVIQNGVATLHGHHANNANYDWQQQINSNDNEEDEDDEHREDHEEQEDQDDHDDQDDQEEEEEEYKNESYDEVVSSEEDFEDAHENVDYY